MGSYDSYTINARNPLARFSHRNRVKRSIKLALSKSDGGKILDYGCGSGVFVASLIELKEACVIGYEPFMEERTSRDLPIYKSFEQASQQGPFTLVTLFETIEHLSKNELEYFLEDCEKILPPSGGILISAPIEIGPALILKSFNRSVLGRSVPEHRPIEFLKACLLGIPARRTENFKISHRGFDFRQAIGYLEGKGWHIEILSYGPLPLGTWYGNSQVYLLATRVPHSRQTPTSTR